MFVSYRWLQEYVDLSGVTAEELADKITKSGIEVEGVENLNKGISGVVIGHVVEREQHPNADKLPLSSKSWRRRNRSNRVRSTERGTRSKSSGCKSGSCTSR